MTFSTMFYTFFFFFCLPISHTLGSYLLLGRLDRFITQPTISQSPNVDIILLYFALNLTAWLIFCSLFQGIRYFCFLFFFADGLVFSSSFLLHFGRRCNNFTRRLDRFITVPFRATRWLLGRWLPIFFCTIERRGVIYRAKKQSICSRGQRFLPVFYTGLVSIYSMKLLPAGRSHFRVTNVFTCPLTIFVFAMHKILWSSWRLV